MIVNFASETFTRKFCHGVAEALCNHFSLLYLNLIGYRPIRTKAEFLLGISLINIHRCSNESVFTERQKFTVKKKILDQYVFIVNFSSEKNARKL